MLAPGDGEDDDVSLQLLDGCKGGAPVWSYVLRGTATADSPGAHHVIWSGSGCALTVCVTADFLRKWMLQLAPVHVNCPRPEDCKGAIDHHALAFGHSEPGTFAAMFPPGTYSEENPNPLDPEQAAFAQLLAQMGLPPAHFLAQLGFPTGPGGG